MSICCVGFCGVVADCRAPNACMIGLFVARSDAFSSSRSFIRFCMSLVMLPGIFACRKSYVSLAIIA